ncbi:MAG: CsgG/HfaB family protein [Gemmatimonadaceae bacterium]|nr:CsgG/HfaB family protein [Gemmatimonadaceae bacterium]
MRRRSILCLILGLAGCSRLSTPPATGPSPAPATGTASPSDALRAAARTADSSARAAIARERAIDASRIDARALAVAPFAVRSSDTSVAPLAYALADLLATDLGRSAQLRMVERLQLAAITRELALAESGRVDSAAAPRVGRLIGASRLIVGALADVGTPGAGRFAVDARIADVRTSRVAEAIRATSTLDAILDAEKQLAFQLFRALNITLTPAERALVEQRPTRSLAALLAYGRAVRAEYRGNLGEAAREYRNVLAADPSFGGVRERVSIPVIAATPAPTPAQAPRPAQPAPRPAPPTISSLDRVIARTADRVTVWTPSQLPVGRGASPVDPVFPVATITIILTVVPPR